MHNLKERVSNQLSRIFSDSSNSRSASPVSSSDYSQTTPHSASGHSLSSYFSLSRFRSSKHQPELKPVQSRPVRWRSKSLHEVDDGSSARYYECNPIFRNEEFGVSCEDQEESIIDAEGKKIFYTSKGDEDHACGRSGSSGSESDAFEEAREQQTPQRLFPNLVDESTFISSELYEFLQSSLPYSVNGCRWKLLYSTLRHGTSLRTLIRNTTGLSGPCLLIAGDKEGAVFGGLLECPLIPTAKRKYQGTNQSFVFTTLCGEPRLFRPTGANRYYYMCMNDLLALGGGGNFALRLDGDLLIGTSGCCDTFGSLCLAHKTEFELKNVELWGFVYSSKYTS